MKKSVLLFLVLFFRADGRNLIQNRRLKDVQQESPQQFVQFGGSSKSLPPAILDEKQLLSSTNNVILKEFPTGGTTYTSNAASQILDSISLEDSKKGVSGTAISPNLRGENHLNPPQPISAHPMSNFRSKRNEVNIEDKLIPYLTRVKTNFVST